MALFDSMAGSYDNFFGSVWGKEVLKYESSLIMKMIKPEPNLRVLDAGCGTGIFTEFLASAGMDVTGFDESPEMLKIAEKKETLKSVRLVRGDISKLPFESESFDRVLCTFVIEFIPDPQSVIDELKRVLKPGGILVLASLNLKGMCVKAKNRRLDKGLEGNVIFRSAEDIKKFGLQGATTDHCVYFLPTTKNMFRLKEWWGRLFFKRNGAVVVIRWQK